MKTYRILGILWFAFCCYSCFNELRALTALHPTGTGLWLAWSVLAGFCLIYLVGGVASLFLFRGARWARWIVALVAAFVAFGCVAFFVTQTSFHVWALSTGAFALVSIPLLFLPGPKPAS